MASGITNVGKRRLLEMAFRNTQDSGGAPDASPFFMALATSAASLTSTVTTFSTPTQIVTGNGYTDGGLAVNRDITDFDTNAVDGGETYGYIRIKDLVWTASGGSLPASGTGAAYALLLDDNALVGSRIVLAWIDLTTGRTIGNGATLTLQDIEIRIT